MKKLKNDLQELEKSLKQLTRKTGLMAKKLAKLEKAKAPKKPRAKAKAPKKPSTRARVAKKVAPKKPAKMSATGSVLEIIKKSRQGVNTASLKKRTGFKDTNIRAILSRLKKQGKVKSPGKGVYQKA